MKIRKILGLMFAATLALVGCSGSNGPTTLKGVSLSGTATKLTYNEGDKFDPTGLTITASYKDSSFTKDVTSSVVWEDLKVGMTSVIGTYTENLFSASVTVSGITVNKITWTAAEKSIIDTHFYGADIPYVGLKDSGALTWDSEYEVATKSGGTSTKAILDNFATAFNGWEDYSCVDAEYVAEYESYYYCFEKKLKPVQEVDLLMLLSMVLKQAVITKVIQQKMVLDYSQLKLLILIIMNGLLKQLNMLLKVMNQPQ